MHIDKIRNIAIDGELLTAEQFNPLRRQWLAGGGSVDDGAGFVRSLAESGELTEFQAAALRSGIPGPYRLGPFRVTGRLLAGRLGNVFRAVHVESQQPVSLKIFPAALGRSRERLARLGRETRIALEVDHLHVVKAFQVGRVGEVTFIALEELTGGNLQQRLERDRKLPYIEACQLIQQAALGLGYLHSQLIIHRDICPANLWVTEDGFVKIMEFGAARDAMSYLDALDWGRLTLDAMKSIEPPQVLGRYDYMPAEQARDPHAANVSSDLYCLGCTLYHSLTGQVPFPNPDPVRQVLQHAEDAPPPLARFARGIPQALQEVLSKALAKNPSDRYSSAEEFSTSLAEIVPPAVLPEVEPLSPEFLTWLQASVSTTTPDLPEVVEYPAAFHEFANYVSQVR
ncbi:MAG: serine/threonine protein kinase [Planctomycetes bacterium]|nr:serine/threonine protein kinase [Planctomycetota bacterium]